MLISKNLQRKSCEISIKIRTLALLSFKGQATKRTTVKWSIQKANEIFSLVFPTLLHYTMFCGAQFLFYARPFLQCILNRVYSPDLKNCFIIWKKSDCVWPQLEKIALSTFWQIKHLARSAFNVALSNVQEPMRASKAYYMRLMSP
mgnify:CR=1 FL=1